MRKEPVAGCFESNLSHSVLVRMPAGRDSMHATVPDPHLQLASFGVGSARQGPPHRLWLPGEQRATRIANSGGVADRVLGSDGAGRVA